MSGIAFSSIIYTKMAYFQTAGVAGALPRGQHVDDVPGCRRSPVRRSSRCSGSPPLRGPTARCTRRSTARRRVRAGVGHLPPLGQLLPSPCSSTRGACSRATGSRRRPHRRRVVHVPDGASAEPRAQRLRAHRDDLGRLLPRDAPRPARRHRRHRERDRRSSAPRTLGPAATPSAVCRAAAQRAAARGEPRALRRAGVPQRHAAPASCTSGSGAGGSGEPVLMADSAPLLLPGFGQQR